MDKREIAIMSLETHIRYGSVIGSKDVVMSAEESENILTLLKEQDEIIKESEKMAELFNDAVARCRKYMEKCGAIPVEKEQKKRFLVTEKGEWIPLDKDTDVLNKIVRCKDCKNAVVYDDNEIICTHIDSNGNDKHPADWFCADGERKES